MDHRVVNDIAAKTSLDRGLNDVRSIQMKPWQALIKAEAAITPENHNQLIDRSSRLRPNESLT
jgi:hypothetical protein